LLKRIATALPPANRLLATNAAIPTRSRSALMAARMVRNYD
jgi:hypothetical protein